ncbi:MAG: ATP-binding protein [Ignavibacteria bacterium]|nr:ATP-binding protein [Ignavibacteria bacterium]
MKLSFFESHNKSKNEPELDEKKYKILFKKEFVRLAVTYILPLLILIVLLQIEYYKNQKENLQNNLHLRAVTKCEELEHYLEERVNDLFLILNELSNFKKINNENTSLVLKHLKTQSPHFLDIAIIDTSGKIISYANSSSLNLLSTKFDNVSPLKSIADTGKYFFSEPLFTPSYNAFAITIKGYFENKLIFLRSHIDLSSINELLSSKIKKENVIIALIDNKYKYLYKTQLGKENSLSKFSPPRKPKSGVLTTHIKNKRHSYGFCWLDIKDWCVICFSQTPETYVALSISQTSTLLSIGTFILFLVVIYLRAKKIVQYEREKEIAEREKNIARLQLEHASKLVAVGELAAGIAHEINNPLAIIASEAGLIKDLINPEFGQFVTFEDLIPHLDNIQNSAFRARDITRKLLTFVRKDDIKLDYYDVNAIIKELVEGFVDRELYVSNIKLEVNLQPDLPKALVDPNSLKQVVVNLLTNARDAIVPPGKITITTNQKDRNILISVKDTGSGISKEQMEKIFLPFYTTKPVGKGTGLGLSVSYNIIKSFGGTIEVESLVGVGSTFTIVLPVKENTELV